MNEGQRIDVLLDLDGTLVYPGGDIKVPVPPLETSYRFAHGALEFLIALDRIPGARIGFYSCGSLARNSKLAELIADAVEQRGHKLKQGLEIFSVVPKSVKNLAVAAARKKKTLKGLRPRLNVESAILVDDVASNAEAGEERNVLIIYGTKRLYDEQGQLLKGGEVFKARIANNLVRAVGLILKAIELSLQSSGAITPVQALEQLQWNGDEYLQESSNGEEIYKLGLAAMQEVQPDFCVQEVVTSVLPWDSQPEASSRELFPTQRNKIFQ